jgi:hypothetical protein
MSAQIGLGMRIESAAEFNRRVLPVLNGITWDGDELPEFIPTVVKLLRAGKPLSDRQQQALYNTIHAFRRYVTDSMVKEFAASKAKGSDYGT